MPVMVGLLDGTTGAEIVPTTLLTLTASEESFTFDLAAGMSKSPVLSAMRGFSAPVYSKVVGQTVGDLAFLMEHDTGAKLQFVSTKFSMCLRWSLSISIACLSNL